MNTAQHTCDGILSAIEESAAKFALSVFVERNVLAVAVPAANAHTWLSVRLLRHVRLVNSGKRKACKPVSSYHFEVLSRKDRCK